MYIDSALHCCMHGSHWLEAWYSCCLLFSDFEESHSAFRDSMPGGFSWEATEVFSGWVPLLLPSLSSSPGSLLSSPCSLSPSACACLAYSFEHVFTACITCCWLPCSPSCCTCPFPFVTIASFHTCLLPPSYFLFFWPFPSAVAILIMMLLPIPYG